MQPNALCCLKQDCSTLYGLQETCFDLFPYYSRQAWPLPLCYTGISQKGQVSATIFPGDGPSKNCVSIFSNGLLHRPGLPPSPLFCKRDFALISFAKDAETRSDQIFLSSRPTHTCVHIHIHICIHVYIHTLYMYLHVQMFSSPRATHICVYIHICIHTYVYIHSIYT